MKTKRLTAYYFMGQDLCMVRRHVREDMTWMKETGTDSVAIGMHEFQLNYGNQQQLDILFDEAARAGMDVHAIPSRWGGLIAGWPSAAGQFAATHPESWVKKADGSPQFAVFCGGAVCSVFDPSLRAHFQQLISGMLEHWPFKGIIWDEFKTLDIEDHSGHAVRALGHPATIDDQIQGTADFFSSVNQFARERMPSLIISSFIYAHLPDAAMKACASIRGLDYFGIDGRCWPETKAHEKVLFGNIGRARSACSQTGAGTLALIETQTMKHSDALRTIEHLPAFLKEPVDHLLYYYYGASSEKDDYCMESMKPLLRQWRDR